MRENITVVDGDFTAQLCQNLGVKVVPDIMFSLQQLVKNRYAVYKTHLDFLRAGARIIRTNTAKMSNEVIVEYLKIDKANFMSIFVTAVELAQKAVYKYYEETGGDTSNIREFNKNRPLIAGHCSGYLLSILDPNKPRDYWNHIKQENLVKFHYFQMKALLKAGVDLLALESISSKIEVEVLVYILLRFRNIRAWMTFCCDDDNAQLLDRTSFMEVAEYCNKWLPGRIIAFGVVNYHLKKQMLLMEDVYTKASETRNLPMMISLKKKSEDKHEVASHCISQLITYGVSFISGGSGSLAEDIKMLHNILSAHSSQPLNSSWKTSPTFSKTCALQDIKNKSKL